ncbi:hypothetical protein FAD_0269 [Ferroplasma acidiphilum]|uniref:Mut7-C RNAse domain-containing protein n=2 Tax=Ferroplasma acidiphilum TaxID=74969 RepID=A0A1V0N273_9ARCH|nr:hypothetical protein FAD_0269 [Ferroplasma acidiphilum]
MIYRHGGEMNKFMADHMLGRTCKWMRIMGYDTGYPQCHSDNDILKKCKEENLILLTRDYEFYKRYSNSIFLDSPDFKEQLKQVVTMFPPDRELFFSRCPECNTILQTVKTETMGPGYDLVKSRYDTVKFCPGCGKYYWEGSHYSRILSQLNNIIKG